MKNVNYFVPVYKTAIPGFKSGHLNRCIIIRAEQLLAAFTTAGVALVLQSFDVGTPRCWPLELLGTLSFTSVKTILINTS